MTEKNRRCMRTLQSLIGLFCTQGFTMIPGSGANSRLALTAHYKAFLHAALMAAAGSASSAVSAWSHLAVHLLCI